MLAMLFGACAAEMLCSHCIECVSMYGAELYTFHVDFGVVYQLET